MKIMGHRTVKAVCRFFSHLILIIKALCHKNDIKKIYVTGPNTTWKIFFMRISSLTRFSSGMLLIAIIGMAASVFWGLAKLKEPFLLSERYHQVVQQVSVKTRLLIDDYLRTGDASALQKAQDFLSSELPEAVVLLPDVFQQALLPEVAKLEESLAVDLRAAGKLSGNIQGLMLQNERELLAALETLQDYIRSGMDTAASDDVQALQLAAFQIAQMNAKRALLRSRYFSSPSDQLKQSLVQISQEIVVKAEQLNQLPLLGIMVEEEEDEFSAMMGLDSDSGDSPAKVADKGDQITDDIYYLTQRYVPELEQTARQVQLGESAKKQVGQLTAVLEARVLESKQYIDQIRTDAENRVITLLIVFLGLLFITGAISALLQFRVLSGMRVVSVYIEKLRSGDFSERLENTMGFTELYELLDCANQLQRYLNQLVSETRQEVDKVQQVSGAIGELAEEIQTGTAEQLARSDEATEAIGSLLASFKLVAEHAVEASSSANEGHNFMHNSAAVMQSLEVSVGEFAEEVEQGVSTIQRLQADSHNIETVLNAIVSIARQTNLLALNASIEAAKAGEQGRGFAVVADEVRMLSARTSEAAQEIRSMIDELRSSSDQVAETMLRQQQQAEHSVVQSERAGAVLQKVMQSITNISHMNNKISEATEKQSSSVDGVQACVSDIQDRTRDASERSEQARSHSAQLAEVSLGLSQLVKRYTI